MMPNKKRKCDISLCKWKKIKKEYTDVYNKGGVFSPFVSPTFLGKTLKYKIFFSKSRFKRFIVVKGIMKNGVIFAPILVDKKAVNLIGDYTSASYTGFVFTDGIKKEDIATFANEVSIYFKKDFVFEKIMPKNFYDGLGLQDGTVCVKIDFNSNFNDYFSSLSKSVRQNYRTAINRMNREEKKYTVQYFVNQKIPSNVKKKMLSLYVKRSMHWDKRNGHLINRIHRRFFDLMNNSLSEIENNFCSILFIDNEISGFMMGLFTNDYSVCTIPRLAIDTKFGVYCPGSILIIESIKKLISLKCFCLDLSRGNEQYKYKNGGKEYRLLTGSIKHHDCLLNN